MRFFESTSYDIQYALRAMRTNLAFTLTAAFIMAISIGGNTAVFSVIRSVLLKPLQYRDPGRLVEITADYPKRNIWNTTFTERDLERLRVEAHSFSQVGAFLWSQENMILSGHGEPEALKAARVSAGFLEILSVRPLIGRGFLPEEDRHNGPAAAIISAQLWKRRFNGDPRILGSTVDLNSTPYTVVGVLPQDFTFPRPGIDVWVTKPSEWSALPPRYWDISTLIMGFARVKPGITLQQARAEFDVFNRRHAAADSGMSVAIMRLAPLKEEVVSKVRSSLWLVFGAVSSILLIACANVAGLLLASASYRSREFAIRIALGAARTRLIRQLLVESVLLSLIGGVLGLLLANWSLIAIRHIAALNLPGTGAVQLDGVVLAFTAGLSVVTGVLFGLVPSLQASRPDIADELRANGTAARDGYGAARLFGGGARGLMVSGQVALSMILLIGAALLLESFAHLENVDPGFRVANLLTAKIALPPARYDTGPKKLAFFDELLRRVRAIPGVRDATMALSLPTTSWLRTNIQIQGQLWDSDPANWPSLQIQSIAPDYFRTLGISLERGRVLTRRDDVPGATPAVIINEAFARQFWPAYPRGENPVGHYLREGADKTGWMQIVGIVADVREGGFARDALPEFYVPTVIHPPQTAYLALRTAGNPLNFTSAITGQIHAIDSAEPLSEVKTMEDVLEATLGQRRLIASLATSFAALALLLAIVGIYGVISYSVAQRTREFGVRRALGAHNVDILRLVLMRAIAISFPGVTAGGIGAFMLTRMIASLLFAVSPKDPLTFFAVAVLFVVLALAASLLPALRAAKIDPMAALRIG